VSGKGSIGFSVGVMSKSGAAIVMFVLKERPTKTKAPMAKYNVGSPMEHIAIDVLGPLPVTEAGNKYILIVADYFTKWVEAFPMANQEACTVAEILVREVVCRFGVPLLIHSDQGRNFEFVLFAEMCRLLSIKKTRTTLTIHNQTEWLKDLITLWRHNCRNLLTIIKKIGTNTFHSF